MKLEQAIRGKTVSDASFTFGEVEITFTDGTIMRLDSDAAIDATVDVMKVRIERDS